MKEIKFRQAIRHPVTSEFLRWHYWGLIEGTFIGIDTGWCSSTKAVGNSFQYTGLKDKNGKEIYQKDSFDGVFSGCYIDWCDKCYSFELFTNECLACLGDVSWGEVVDEIQKGNVEIIGTIYENKEVI